VSESPVAINVVTPSHLLQPASWTSVF